MTLFEILKDLDPKGLSNGQIKSKCPFRENHSAGKGKGDGSSSFFMTPDKNLYHCFSCGAGGTLLKLLTVVFKIPYFEANELVRLVDYKDFFKSGVKEFELDFYWDLDKLPQEFLDRGIKKEVLEYFKVGLDSNKDIVIPMYEGYDLKGISFRQQKKYTKGDKKVTWYSEGFQKEHYLYNYSDTYKEATLVEGPTDLFTVFGFGITNVVGLLGVSCSKEQLEKMSKIPVWNFALDADSSGIKAMNFIYKNLYKHVDEINFIDYLAKDPGSSTKRNFLRGLAKPYTYAEFKVLTS